MARVTLLLAASASAFELPASLSRRAVLARAASIAPAIGFAQQALADSNNEYLGYGKAELGRGDADKFNALGNKGSEPGKTVNEFGSAPTGKNLYSPSYIAKSAPPRAVAGVRLGGKYADPMHPGCKREVTLIGTNKVLINGADEDGKAWKVRGTYEGKTVTIDFTPKGGPKDVTATYTIGKGLTFPDGNTWAKL